MDFAIFSRIIDFLRGQRAFTRNANKLFKELLSTTDDNFNAIQIFSAKELKKATNNFDEQQIIVKDGCYNLYRGLLPGCPIIVKKFVDTMNSCEEPIKDIVFASVFGSHDNMLMLLGCCLDTQLPILVFEYAENGTLADRIFKPLKPEPSIVPNYKFICRNNEPLTWKRRLQVAMDLCNAIAYLHTQFPKPIVHRDIKARTILLDKQNSPKLFDFSLSVPIPDGELWKKDMVKGIYGYIAPEYLSTRRFNEKVDVYSLGAVLLELLSGKTMYELSRVQVNGKGLMEVLRRDGAESGLAKNMNDIVDVAILEEAAWPEKELQLRAFAAISVECLCCDVEKRPTISQVSRFLNDINSMATSLI